MFPALRIQFLLHHPLPVCPVQPILDVQATSGGRYRWLGREIARHSVKVIPPILQRAAVEIDERNWKSLAHSLTWPQSVLPRTASLPGMGRMPFGCHSSDERHDELLDAAHNRFERDRFDIELVLRVEGGPLPLLRFVVKEL